jgi:hypothetical protein
VLDIKVSTTKFITELMDRVVKLEDKTMPMAGMSAVDFAQLPTRVKRACTEWNKKEITRQQFGEILNTVQCKIGHWLSYPDLVRAAASQIERRFNTRSLATGVSIHDTQPRSNGKSRPTKAPKRR